MIGIIPPGVWPDGGAIPAKAKFIVVNEDRAEDPETRAARKAGAKVYVYVHLLTRRSAKPETGPPRRFERTPMQAFATGPTNVFAIDDADTVTWRANELGAFATRIVDSVDGLVIGASFRNGPFRYGWAAREFVRDRFGLDLVDFAPPGAVLDESNRGRKLPQSIADALREQSGLALSKIGFSVTAPFRKAGKPIELVVIPSLTAPDLEAELYATGTWRDLNTLPGVTGYFLRLSKPGSDERNALRRILDEKGDDRLITTYGPASVGPDVVRTDE